MDGRWTPIVIVPFLTSSDGCNAVRVRCSSTVCTEHKFAGDPMMVITPCIRDRLNAEAQEKHGVGLNWEFATWNWDQIN